MCQCTVLMVPSTTSSLFSPTSSWSGVSPLSLSTSGDNSMTSSPHSTSSLFSSVYSYCSKVSVMGG